MLFLLLLKKISVAIDLIWHDISGCAEVGTHFIVYSDEKGALFRCRSCFDFCISLPIDDRGTAM